jgi:hypothetical protein
MAKMAIELITCFCCLGSIVGSNISDDTISRGPWRRFVQKGPDDDHEPKDDIEVSPDIALPEFRLKLEVYNPTILYKNLLLN